MNGVHIEQPCDMLHVDLFSSIYQKSNSEKMMSPKDTDLTLFLDDKFNKKIVMTLLILVK